MTIMRYCVSGKFVLSGDDNIPIEVVVKDVCAIGDVVLADTVVPHQNCYVYEVHAVADSGQGDEGLP